MEKELVVTTLAEYANSSEKVKELLMAMIGESKNNIKLTEEEKEKAAYALNMCTVSVSQIIDYKDLNILEQEYDAILNNINLEQMPKDEALLHILKQILDTITYFRIEEGDKKLVEKEYQQKMKNAIWSAVPNFGLIVAGGSPLTMAISLASQVGIGYMNYRRNREEYNLDKERQLWQLQRSAIEQFNGLRRELFDTAWRLADAYDFPDEYRLTERQISQYNSILTDTDELRKYERLEFIKEKFNAYPPFWYFIGNVANYIAGNSTLKLSESTRKIYKEKAKSYFEKYEKLNKFNILREDKLISTCALEHIDLLIEEENGIVKKNESKINELLTMALKSAGNSFDVIELCAITYLKLNKKEEAAKLLRMLINEDYNTIINAQLLSSIYVYDYYKSKNSANECAQITADYELLSERVGKDYLFPLPEKNENILLLEGNFGSKQKIILKSMFTSFLQSLLQKYSIEWNKISSVFELGKDYPNSFFLDTDAAKNRRNNEIKKIFMHSEKAEHYRERMANADYSLNLLRILNTVYNTIFKFNFFGDEALLNNVEDSVLKAINECKDEINGIQDSMLNKKFNIKEYQASQNISVERFMHDSIEILLDYIKQKIDRIDNLNEITSIESDLRAFCIKNDIKDQLSLVNDGPEVLQPEIEDRFYPSLLGHKTVVAKKNSDFVKEMTSFVKERMKDIVCANKNLQIYYNGEPGFDNYFYNERFNEFGSLKRHSIMIVSGGCTKDVDLIFTTEGVVTVIEQRVKYNCKYMEIDKKKNAIELYNGYFRPLKYENDSLNMNQFYNLIQEIGRKFIITNIEEKTDYVEEATPSDLNKWFKMRSDSLRDNVIRVYAIPDKNILKGLGYRFDVDFDPEHSILQFYYDKNTKDLLGMRLVIFKNINSKFQALLIEKGIFQVY